MSVWDRYRRVSVSLSRSAHGLTRLTPSICTGLVLLMFQPSRSAAKPMLVCDAPGLDFGIARETQTVSRTFLLRNTGDAPVTIERVHHTCGCTTSAATRPSVPPGESEPLTVTFDLKGRRGVQRRAVYVFWNSPDGLPLQLMLTGKVVADIEIEPAGAFFVTVPPQGTLERRVRIHDPAGSRPFHIAGVTCADSRFTTRIETGVEGRDYRLVVASAGPREAGEIKATVSVTTDHPEHPVLDVPVYLRVQDPGEPATLGEVRENVNKGSL